MKDQTRDAEPAGRPVYALAASRGEFEPMRARLEQSTGATFILIQDRARLTAEYLTSQHVSRVFLPHWSYIIPASVYEKIDCVVFHMTDLPFGRGGSPLQNLISRGIKETKISALKCVKELDAGPVYLKAPLTLDGSAEEIMARAYGIVEGMIRVLHERNPPAVPQEGMPTLFRRRTPDEGRLDDCSSVREFYDRIRMLDADGYPHAFIEAGGFRIEFRKAALEGESVTAEVRIIARPEKKTAGALHAK